MRSAAKVGVAAATAILLTMFSIWAIVGIFNISPFGLLDAEQTIVTERPAVLQSLTDIAEFDAATGQFQVLVEVERDNRFLPGIVAGERALLLAQGDVDAYVDFSDLNELNIQESFEGTRITIVLPPAQVDDPVIDFENSTVVNRERGVLTRLGQALSEDAGISETELFILAEQQLRDAAEDTDLKKRAEANTRKMLQGLLGGLGYEEVYVVFSVASSSGESPSP